MSAPATYPKNFSSLSGLAGSVAVPLEKTRPDRVPSIDVLRGLAMILMALDHTRIHFAAQMRGRPPLIQSNLPFFFTRWMPGFCAPTFVFLAGLAAYLQLSRGKTKAELSRFLLTRGLWLILLEATLMNFGWFFVPTVPALGVLWALGASMVLLAGLVWLPIPVVAAAGVLLIAGHNLFDSIQASSLGAWSNLWILLHEPGFALFRGKPAAFVIYPAVPWNGVMILGFCFGRIMTLDAVRRVRVTAICGAWLLGLFAALRGLRLYGDPHPWLSGVDVATSIKSFLAVDHNPVSLQYCAMSLGLALLILAGIDSLLTSGRALWLRRWVEVYGRAPLVYYLLHIYLIHASAMVLCAWMGDDWRGFALPLLQRMGAPLPQGFGVGLPAVYLIWVAIVVSLYWPVRRYAEYKRAHPEKAWLSYL